ncbi:MAG: hypothetical protein R3D68_07000 [Hyphomicrobiaceae bacterium]
MPVALHPPTYRPTGRLDNAANTARALFWAAIARIEANQRAKVQAEIRRFIDRHDDDYLAKLGYTPQEIKRLLS